MFTSPHRFFIAALSLWLLLNSSSAITTTHAQARAYVTNMCDNTVVVIDTDTNRVVATVPVDFRPRGVLITPDGARIYVTNSESNLVTVIDTETNTVVATIPVDGFPIKLAITPDGARVYVANFAIGTVSVIDTATNTVVNTIDVGGPFVFDVAITPDGARLYVTSGFGESFTITIFDTATNAVVGTILPIHPSGGVVFTPDGARGYLKTNEFLNVIDTATNTIVVDILQANVFHNQLAITTDGTRLYATGVQVPAVSVIDTSTNAVVNTIPLGFNPLFLAITADGTRVYTANVQNTVSVIDAVTNTVIATLQLEDPANPSFGCLSEIAITPVPRNKDDCKDGGYRKFRGLGFPNQGQCVKYVNRHAN